MVGATCEEGRVVTNGMSQYSRNERNANSGIVVAITPDDYPVSRWLVWISARARIARLALGGSNYKAPAQRLADFSVAAKPSSDLGTGRPSYAPGVTPTDLSTALPDFAIEAIREALPAFAKQIPGFDHPDAVLTLKPAPATTAHHRGADLQSTNTPGCSRR